MQLKVINSRTMLCYPVHSVHSTTNLCLAAAKQKLLVQIDAVMPCDRTSTASIASTHATATAPITPGNILVMFVQENNTMCACLF